MVHKYLNNAYIYIYNRLNGYIILLNYFFSCTPVSEISLQLNIFTRKYPYTTEGDIRHKKHNKRFVQIANTIDITIVKKLNSNIK